MKQRIISVFLIICLVFTAFSCSKAPENITVDNYKEENSVSIDDTNDACVIPYDINLGGYIDRCTDLFTATVLDCEVLPEKTQFTDYQINISTPVLYTVEVKSVLRDFSVTENTRIGVVRFVRKADEQSEKYFLPFEVGKTYLVCGKVQLLNNKPVILDDGSFSVELKEDRSLVPLSIRSGELFENVETYNEFLQNEDVKTVLETRTIKLPSAVKALLKTDPMTIHLKSEAEQLEYSKQEKDIYGVVLSEKEEVRQLIREAIPIESQKTIKISTVSE